jgi:hypothetical protein
MDLKHLTDKSLLQEIKRLSSAERELTLKILHHLREIERRKLYCDLGFTSLFDYCVRELGYAEASAHRRIVSARMLNDIPSIENKIESGALTLTNLTSLNQFFREENITDNKKKEALLLKIEGLSKRECDLKLMQLSEIPVEKKHCLWISDSTMEKVKDYRNLKGTKETSEEIISETLTNALAELHREKFKLVKIQRKPNVSESRTPSASVKREVYLRDKKCVKCGSVFGLQYDHRKPFSLGGKSTPENIRLLCANCNQRERIRQRL